MEIIDCFIPCRKKGDFINDLNFLELEEKKLVEHSIIVAKESKIFRSIYLISDEKKKCENIAKINNIKFIYTKNTKSSFFYMLRDILKKDKKYSEKICVLLPNYPFKNFKTIKKIFKIFKKNNLNFICSCSKQKSFFYKNNKNLITNINYDKNIKTKKNIDPIYKLAGGIFFYKSNVNRINFNNINKKNIYITNDHESHGIFSLYDFITASSLINIDNTILKKLM